MGIDKNTFSSFLRFLQSCSSLVALDVSYNTLLSEEIVNLLEAGLNVLVGASQTGRRCSGRWRNKGSLSRILTKSELSGGQMLPTELWCLRPSENLNSDLQ